VLFFAAACAATVHAQGAPDVLQPVLRDRPSIAMAVAVSRCPALLGNFAYELEMHDAGDRRIARSCTVASVDTLRRSAGSLLVAVRYLARQLFAADSIGFRPDPRASVDTADVLDVVIYSATAGADSWRAEWRQWVDRVVMRDMIPTAAAVRGGDLVSVLNCVNGTGGCSQDFFLRSGQAKWTAVTPRYLASLKRRFGLSFWKGVNVDVRSLQGDVPLYSPGDGNCCPSRLLSLTLQLVGHALDIKSAVPRPAPPE
jgi:hypothetical protein